MLGIRSQRPKFLVTVNNEKGVALVLAMVMLVLMSILGTFALSTSTTEIGISGNYRNSQDAFYAADSAVEYASTDGNIYASASLLVIGGTVNLNTDAGGAYLTNISINNSGRVSGLDTTATNNVTYLASGSPPPGSGYDEESFQARYFLIQVTATGPNESKASVESQTVKIVPKAS